MSERQGSAAIPGRTWRPEQLLLVDLAAWSVWSVGVGTVLWRLGRREGSALLTGAGRVTVAWGAADAAAAGWGAWRSRRPSPGTAQERLRRMALVTGASAVADVLFVAAGVRWSQVRGRRGEGLATACQGLYLLYLDARSCLQFAVAVRSGDGTGPVGPLESARARERRRPAPGGGDGPRTNDTAVVRRVW